MQLPVTPETLAGVVGGAANIVSGFPFDTVKVHMQHAPPGRYAGSLDCCRHLVRAHGVRGLYRGMAAPLVGGSLECGVNYGVFYGMNKHLQGSKQGKDMQLGGLVASGMVSGAVLSLILAPVELIKCRLQTGAPPEQSPYRGPADVVRRIVAEEGAWGSGLARGLGATLAREIPGNTIFFVVYESMRSFLLPRGAAQSRERQGEEEGVAGTGGGGGGRGAWAVAQEAASAVLCGGVAGAVFWGSVLPVDGAKTRIQAAVPGSPNDVSVWQHLTKMHRQAGLRGLYAGLQPTVVRAFPANACQFLAYEMALQAMTAP